jgi:hypothetical protein
MSHSVLANLSLHAHSGMVWNGEEVTEFSVFVGELKVELVSFVKDTV